MGNELLLLLETLKLIISAQDSTKHWTSSPSSKHSCSHWSQINILMKCFSCHCKDKIKKENLFHTMICERNRCDKNLADPQRFTTHISFLYDIFNYIYSHKHASELNTFTRTIILHKSNVCFTSPKHKIMFLPVLQLVLTSTRAAHSSAVGTTGQRVTWVMKGMCVCKMLPYAKAS